MSLVVTAGRASGVARAPGACMLFRGPRGIASAASDSVGWIARRRSDALLVRPASAGNAARGGPGVRDTRRTFGGDHLWLPSGSVRSRLDREGCSEGGRMIKTI